MKRTPLLLSIFFISTGLAAQTESHGQSQSQTQAQAPVKPPAKLPVPRASQGPKARQSEGPSRLIEEVVARVNNEIITASDLERSRQQLAEEIRQECASCTQEQYAARVAEKEKNLLRDLIDQSLLAQRGKDLGISVETKVVKRLDEIRQRNGLESMEALERAIEAQGSSFEDFKNNIRNALLTEEVIRREVQSDIQIDRSEAQKYYDAHKEDFKRPDMVYLREIFVTTDKKTDAEIPELEKKANTLLERVKKGEDFGELAKHFSDGQTAKEGGELGEFKRGELDPKIEEVVFKLNRNQLTDVIRTKNGFMILQMEMRYEAGIQPLDKVENEIMYRLQLEKTEPALRNYLKTLREESYVVVKSGYVDTAAVSNATAIEERPASPDNPKSDKSNKANKGKKGKISTGRPGSGGSPLP